ELRDISAKSSVISIKSHRPNPLHHSQITDINIQIAACNLNLPIKRPSHKISPTTFSIGRILVDFLLIFLR
ncbi:10829_t:CDS:2, partial [Dentiscutata heterogama]